MSIEINGAGVITGVDSLSTPAVTNAAGSASTPSITFTGDTNTGLYSPGADQVAVTTGGTARLYIDSSGRVGVGTTSPATTLDVNGDVTIADKIIHSGDTDTAIRFPTADTVALETNNARRLTVYSDGNISVGPRTTTPGELLALETLTGASLSLGHSGQGRWIVATDNANLKISDLNGEKARIDSSGRLLLGTSSARDKFFNTTFTPGFQLEGIGDTFRGASIVSDVAGNGGSYIILGHQRSGSVGGNTIVNDGDELGLLSFQGSDGAELVEAARIEAKVDGTPGTNDMPGRLVFSTSADGSSSPTERMRINQAGALWAFTGSTGGFKFSTSQAASTDLDLLSGYYSASAVNTGTTAFVIRTNGNIQNANNSYGSLSDAKLKENIVDATSQWSDIKALQVRKYNFKEGQTHTQIGLIAQEVELISPGLVSESPDRDADGNDLGTVTKSVNYSVLYMKAVKALQEAMERIETLEAKVAALESA